MSAWKEFFIEELADFHNSTRVPLSAMQRADKKGIYPYYGASGIVDYIDSYLFDGSFILISEDGENLKTRNTPIAFEATGKFWVNNHAHILKAKKEYLTKLLILYFAQLDLNPYLTGAVQPKLNKASLSRIPIYLPKSEQEQKAISDVLSALDDKIDLLQRQNETLEKMAETLFRQWFIEEAKEDWEEVPVGDFGAVVCGKTPSKKNESYYGNDIPFLKIPDMHGNIFISTTTDNLSLDGSESQIKKLLPKNSICVSCIATVGLVCINDVELHTNQQINSIVLDNKKYLYFLFLTMKSMYEELHNLASGGTATLNLNTGDFSKILISKPDEKSLEMFNQVAIPSFDKIRKNAQQIQTLQNLRDTLLPKLMSGEVRVKLD